MESEDFLDYIAEIQMRLANVLTTYQQAYEWLVLPHVPSILRTQNKRAIESYVFAVDRLRESVVNLHECVGEERLRGEL